MFTDTKKLSEDGAWVHIEDKGRPAYLENKKGEPDESKPIRIKVLGPHSETLQNRNQKRAAELIKKHKGDVDFSKMSLFEIEAFLKNSGGLAAERMADAVIAWENMPEDLEFSRDAAVKLFTDYPSILEQVSQEAGEIGDFLALAIPR